MFTENQKAHPLFTHQNIAVNGIPIHITEASPTTRPSILFIHGWPTSWKEFESVMTVLSNNYHVIAMDLPGIGDSKIPLQSYRKSNISNYVLGLLDTMDIKDVTLVGCDCGGQVVYAFLKKFPHRASRAIIMNVAIPGVEPWETVKNNPYIWHFKLHLISDLPEKLVHGKQLEYFSYFYDTLVGKGNRISDDFRKCFSDAYSSLESLKSGFELYRNFSNDENDNMSQKEVAIQIPVLYLRGEDEPVNIETYIKGFRENGFKNVKSAIIEHCGHFSAMEQPEKVALAIKNFIISK
ncbi:alpha/beta fold hydrolase [Fusibacter ferrireducens]|uniref:Alpha/beta hydrolase n=1 Tax=Fusibacter ferrireducens TaxID=2785058 RepID=A0ABR9ZPJ9_9FIRM|nr:alpha/beta hydrolase [Fusibacter ferrireducens]MBF4692241.1 alpha/beta hydrolase [Fusibacter ferrireducens]